MEMLYLVSYTRHNAESGAWAYKVEFASKSKDEAEKKYHALLGEYIDSDTFDFVTVELKDNYGNSLEHKNWQKTVTVVAKE